MLKILVLKHFSVKKCGSIKVVIRKTIISIFGNPQPQYLTEGCTHLKTASMPNSCPENDIKHRLPRMYQIFTRGALPSSPVAILLPVGETETAETIFYKFFRNIF